jgi:hypothetical protein
VNWTSKSAVATGIAGVGLLVPASIGLLLTGTPTTLCPFPTLTIVPAFLLANVGLWKAAIAVPMLCFFAWNPGLFHGESKIPKRSHVLLIILILLSIADFLVSWKPGLHYRGPEFTRAVYGINALWIAFLALGFGRTWREPSSFRYSLFLHWMLFAWLAWYAFPYTGELP